MKDPIQSSLSASAAAGLPRVILHVATGSEAPAMGAMAEAQRARSGWIVGIVRLDAGEPDYAGLVDRVFSADSITTW